MVHDARQSLKQKCHFDEIFITGCIGSCHFDNFQCSQWWTFHQNEDFSVSVMSGMTGFRESRSLENESWNDRIWPGIKFYIRHAVQSDTSKPITRGFGISWDMVRDHLCMGSERRRYNVTSSLIGWAHTQNDNDPWCWQTIFFSWTQAQTRLLMTVESRPVIRLCHPCIGATSEKTNDLPVCLESTSINARHTNPYVLFA